MLEISAIEITASAMKNDPKSMIDPIGGLPGTALRSGINANKMAAIIEQAGKISPRRQCST